MATPLGKKLAGQTAPPAAKSPAAVVLERGPRGELLEVPGLGRVWMNLLGAAFWESLEFELAEHLKGRGLNYGTVSAEAVELYKDRRVLAHAARDPDDRAKPFGSIEEWGEIDADTVVAAMSAFGEMRERLTPLDVQLTQEHHDLILAAVRKKNTTILRSFGLNVLATWLATTEFQPATSPMTRSSDGESSSES